MSIFDLSSEKKAMSVQQQEALTLSADTMMNDES